MGQKEQNIFFNFCLNDNKRIIISKKTSFFNHHYEINYFLDNSETVQYFNKEIIFTLIQNSCLKLIDN